MCHSLRGAIVIYSYSSKVLSKQANKALFSLMKQLSNLSYPKPSLMCHLFDSLIKPVMNYVQKYGTIPFQLIMTV